MGTYYRVTVADAVNDAAVGRLTRIIEETLVEIDNQMSTYIGDSELSRFNLSSDTGWRDASPALVEVLLEARRVSELSAGAFDVTVGPLVNLWGFGPDPDPGEAPTANAVWRAASGIGYHRLEVRASPPGVRKRIPQLYVDLSAIAKGYAVDRLAARLAAAGAGNTLVDIGGEVYASGLNPSGEPWRIGIEKPEEGARGAIEFIPLSNAAVATSGNYRNYVELDGRRYPHEIDPYTGRPVTHRTALVSVIASRAMEADALATALLVLGSEAGLALARRHGVAAYFVDHGDDGPAVSASPAFRARLANGST